MPPSAQNRVFVLPIILIAA